MNKTNDYLIYKMHCDFARTREWGALKWFLEMTKENQIKYALKHFKYDEESRYEQNK